MVFIQQLFRFTCLVILHYSFCVVKMKIKCSRFKKDQVFTGCPSCFTCIISLRVITVGDHWVYHFCLSFPVKDKASVLHSLSHYCLVFSLASVSAAVSGWEGQAWSSADSVCSCTHLSTCSHRLHLHMGMRLGNKSFLSPHWCTWQCFIVQKPADPEPDWLITFQWTWPNLLTNWCKLVSGHSSRLPPLLTSL